MLEYGKYLDCMTWNYFSNPSRPLPNLIKEQHLVLPIIQCPSLWANSFGRHTIARCCMCLQITSVWTTIFCLQVNHIQILISLTVTKDCRERWVTIWTLPIPAGSCFDKVYHTHRQVIYNNPQLPGSHYLSQELCLQIRLKCWQLGFSPSAERGEKRLTLSLAHIAGCLLQRCPGRECLGIAFLRFYLPAQ